MISSTLSQSKRSLCFVRLLLSVCKCTAALAAIVLLVLAVYSSSTYGGGRERVFLRTGGGGEACPRFVCVNTHIDGGLGHRVTNLLQGALLSLALGIPLAAPRLEVGIGARHGDYPGADDLFRPDESSSGSAMRCPRSEADVPPGWTYVWLGGISRDIVEALPAVPPALLPVTAKCGAVYVAYEFWPNSYAAAVPQLRAMYRPSSTTGAALLANLRYDATRFNIAVHVRVGDFIPTPLDYFPDVLGRVLAELDPLLRRPRDPLPVDVWIFAEEEYPWALFESVIQHVASGGAARTNVNASANDDGAVALLRSAGTADVRLRAYAANMSALATLVHLIESDTFIGADSSLSYIASFLGTRPAVLTAPNLGREVATFENFIPGNVRVSAKRVFEPGHVIARAQRWLNMRHK